MNAGILLGIMMIAYAVILYLINSLVALNTDFTQWSYLHRGVFMLILWSTAIQPAIKIAHDKNTSGGIQ